MTTVLSGSKATCWIACGDRVGCATCGREKTIYGLSMLRGQHGVRTDFRARSVEGLTSIFTMANNWFPHDSAAGMDQHVLLLRGEWGNAGYGMFWLALEAMYETSDGALDAGALPALCIRMNESKDVVARFFDYCVEIGLFVRKDGKIYSERLMEEKARLLAVSDAQRRRAESRWSKEKGTQSTAGAMPPQSRGNAPTVPTHIHNQEDKPPCKENWTDEQIIRVEQAFKSVTVQNQWCDKPYAEKTWDQSLNLRTERRNEFYRKVTLMLTWAKLPKHAGRAKLLFHEIAGYVNDKGAMERVLDNAEVARRRQFAREESGEAYVHDELSPPTS